MTRSPCVALSIRMPWWWAILHAGKTVENRDWRPSNPCRKFRGRVWVHASAHRHAETEADAWHFIKGVVGRDRLTEILRTAPLAAEASYRGAIVGSVEIVDWIDSADHPAAIAAGPWYVGPGALLLRDPVALAKPIPLRGMLGFFPVPVPVLDQLKAAA